MSSYVNMTITGVAARREINPPLAGARVPVMCAQALPRGIASRSTGAVCALLFVATCGSAVAADVAWTDCSDGRFDDNACWSGGAVPDVGDDVRLDAPLPSFAVRWDGATLANWNMATGNALVEVTNNRLNVGNGVDVTLYSESGSGGHSYRILGDAEIGGGATLNLGAADAALGDPIALFVGGTVDVGLAGSTGSLNVRDGSELTSTTTSIVAQLTGSHGTVNVSGTGATWTVLSSLEIGRLGTAFLNISDGGGVSNTSAIISRLGGSGAVTVAGAGSQWTNTGLLRVGFAGRGNGSLAITDGGTVTSAGAYLGILASDGMVTVGNDTDLSIWTNTGDLAIGGTDVLAGSGTASSVTVNHGGQVDVTGVIKTWDAGTVNLAGGAITATTADFSLGTFNFTDGSLTINGGSFTAFDPALPFGFTDAMTIDSVTPGANPTLILTNGAAASAASVIRIGLKGRGALRLEAGAVASMSIGATLGVEADSVGAATVTGAGSRWGGPGGFSFVVGGAGDGTLDVEAGGVVDDFLFFTIGDQGGASGEANVTGAGSRVDDFAELTVGSSGRGALNITAGGVVSADSDGVIGNATTGNGSVTVSGSGSQLATRNLIIGHFGSATLLVRDGGLVTNRDGTVGVNTGPDRIGMVTISDAGSHWTNTEKLTVNGVLNVEAGSTLSSFDGVIGDSSNVSAGALVNVTGLGSRWDTSTLALGESASGTLNVAAGGAVSATGSSVLIGKVSGQSGAVRVSGSGSQLTTRGERIGDDGNGTLDILDGGLVTSTAAGSSSIVAADAGAIGAVTVSGESIDGTRSTWANNQLTVGFSGNATLAVLDGGLVTTRLDSTIGSGTSPATSSGAVTVSGVSTSGRRSTWNSQGGLAVGVNGPGLLDILDGGLVTHETLARIGFSATHTGVVSVSGVGDGDRHSSWNSSAGIEVGTAGRGRLDILDGGQVSAMTGTIGRLADATGIASVNGPGSRWDILGELRIGDAGDGTLDIGADGEVANAGGFIGYEAGSFGTVTVAGAQAVWNSSASVYVGGSDVVSGGTGVLNVGIGGAVDVADSLTIWDAGTVNLDGGTLTAGAIVKAGSTFNFNAGVLNIGGDFLVAPGEVFGSSFTLGSSHELNVAGRTTITPSSTLTLDGGTFSTGSLAGINNFEHISGTLNLTNTILSIGATGLFGDVVHMTSSQLTNVTMATVIEKEGVLVVDNAAVTSAAYTNLGEVILTNTAALLNGDTFDNAGLVHGDGAVAPTLRNEADGQVRVRSGDRVLFTGAGNTNAGEINMLGGAVEFSADLTNEAGGFIGGRGELKTDGLNNEGVLAFTGTANVFGDVDNNGAGRILASGGASLTFFGHVVHDGAEIRASVGSLIEFKGGFSGSGGALAGDFFLEGDLRPGNSPGLLDIDGNVTFGALNMLEIELGGLTREAEYDAVNVSGLLTLGGTLNVVLLDLGGGLFNPQLGHSFDIFDAGSIIASFAGINLPGLQAGLKWNTSQLESSGLLSVAAVPLPGAIWLFLPALIGMVAVRRR